MLTMSTAALARAPVQLLYCSMADENKAKSPPTNPSSGSKEALSSEERTVDVGTESEAKLADEGTCLGLWS